MPEFDKIRTGHQLGRDRFYQLYKDPVPLDAGTYRNLDKRYIELRGLFVPKKRDGYNAIGFDESRKFLFQFNPTTIEVEKQVVYSPRAYTGLDYQDYIWANGGAKTLSFQLFMDATPGSYHSYFRKTEANGDSVYDEVDRLKPRGLHDEIELLESFMRPEVPENGVVKVPRFSSGGVVPPNQFYPPPTLIFVYGDFYLEGILSECRITTTLFNSKLQPVRAIAEVVFVVFERVEVKIQSALKSASR